jgi:hypothetical protein
MPGCRVVRIADERIPEGHDWLVLKDAAGDVCAFVRASLEMVEAVKAAIRRAVAALLVAIPQQRTPRALLPGLPAAV